MQCQLSLSIDDPGERAAELARVSHTLIRLEIGSLADDIITPLSRLIEEPEEYRHEWEFAIKKRHQGRPDPDDGLIRRDGGPGDEPDERFDRKFVFMYRPRLDWLLTWRGVDRKGYAPLLTACEQLMKRCRIALLPIVQELDVRLPGHQFELHFMNAIMLQQDAIRAIIYDAGHPQGAIAKPHTDRDFLTIQVAESRPGMRFGKARTLYRWSPGTALVFTGKKIAAHTGGEVAALEHDVVETETVGGGRWSLIYFGHITLPAGVTIPHGE